MFYHLCVLFNVQIAMKYKQLHNNWYKIFNYIVMNKTLTNIKNRYTHIDNSKSIHQKFISYIFLFVYEHIYN